MSTTPNPEEKKQRKTGVLAGHEEKFIRDNADKLSYYEIAATLNRTPERVKRFIQENALVGFEMDEKDAYRSQLRHELLHKDFFVEIKKQFSQETGELGHFINMWVNLMESLQDVRPEEEIQLKQLIVIDILLNRSMIARNEFIANIGKIEEKIREEAQKPKDQINRDRIELLNSQADNMKAAISQFTQEFVKLSERQDKMAQSLKTTRAQRISKVADSKVNWAGLVRRFEEWQEREKEGRQIGIMTLAAQKARQKLSEVHIYEDGVADLPLLNSETVTNLDDIEITQEKNDDDIQSEAR